MSKDKELIERMMKKMSGADTSRHSASEMKDMNKNVSYKNFNNELFLKDIYNLDDNKNQSLTLNVPNENLSYMSTDTTDSKDYTATYVYKFPPRDGEEFRLLYAKVNEVRLRMEKVMSSNDDVDYAYELKKYKEWLENIVK